MSKQLKWAFGIVLALAVVMVAQAALQEFIYMPLVYRQSTPTSSATITLTPTITPTGPTPTRTPTITPTPVPRIYIKEIHYKPDPGEGPLDEYVAIRNDTNASVDMTNWTLKDEPRQGERQIFTFPQFTLRAYSTVKVITKFGDNDASNLYWDRSTEVWEDASDDCAYVHEDEPEGNPDLVDALCYEVVTGLYYEPTLP